MTKEESDPTVIKLLHEYDLQGIENCLLKGEKVDATDSNGMTALQHAAYKGQLDTCKMLLKYGAEVNADYHDEHYSALHFSALSGKIEITKLLLQAGAHTHHLNALGRTAAQMAAFVGNHETVSVINNYVPLGDVQYYSKIQGLETEPKLDPGLVAPLYDTIMQTNLHPVFHAIRACCNFLHVSHVSQCSRVLGLMCEKEAKRTDNVNEVICLKFHYLSYILKAFAKEIQKDAEKKSTDTLRELDLNTDKIARKEGKLEDTKEVNGKEKDKKLWEKDAVGNKESAEDGGTKTPEHERIQRLPLEPLIRKWLKATPNGAEPHQQSFIIDAIKSFPYTEFHLFMQMVRHLSGGGDALNILTGCINGPVAFNDQVRCSTCGSQKEVSKKCSKCKCVHYCNRTCQRLHWGTHKRECDKLNKQSARNKLAEKGRMEATDDYKEEPTELKDSNVVS